MTTQHTDENRLEIGSTPAGTIKFTSFPSFGENRAFQPKGNGVTTLTRRAHDQHTDEMREAEWAETKQLYSEPDSIIDIGNMYWWAEYWHQQAHAATASAEAKYLPVVEKLVERLRDVKKQPAWINQELEARIDRDIDLAAPLLKEKNNEPY